MARRATIPRRDVALGWRVLDIVIRLRGTRRRGPSRLWKYVLLAPAVAMVSLLAVGLVLLLWRSLHTFDPFLYQQGEASLANYEALLDSPAVGTTFARTFGMAAATTIVAMLLAVPYAYVLTRTHSRLVRLGLLSAMFFPLMTGDIVRVYGWLAFLGREGAIAWVSERLGLGTPDILGTLLAVGIGSVQILMPLCVLVLVPAFYQIDRELERAAATLGARPSQVWRTVLLPLAWPGLVGATVISMAVAANEFATPAMLGQGLRDYVANLVQRIVLERDNQYLGSALGVMLLLAVALTVTTIIAVGQRLGRGVSVARASEGGDA